MAGLRGRGWYTPHKWGDPSTDVVLVGGSQTLTSDLVCKNLILQQYTIITNGWRIICAEDLIMTGTVPSPSFITCNGGAGTPGGSGGGGGSGGSAGFYNGGFSGGNGNSSGGSAGSGTSLYSIAQANGGVGGDSSPSHGGGGSGHGQFDPTTYGTMIQPSVFDLGRFFGPSAFVPVAGGGGGGGGSGDGSLHGGGGGGGGGVVGIFARNIILTGRSEIQAKGGVGGNAAGGGGAGGGGGGAGGALILSCERLLFPDGTVSALVNASGAVGGTASSGTGLAGGSGGNGNYFIVSERGTVVGGTGFTGADYPNGIPTLV